MLGRLRGTGAEAKVIAGGQSLVAMMNFRLARPDHLIDLSAIAALQGIARVDGGWLRIGAMVRQRDCLESELVGRLAPPLTAALAQIGHSHIRNRGTVGGSVAHADPAAELPTVLTALDAELEIVGTGGSRRVSAEEFFDGWFTTAVDEDELLVAVHVPAMGTGLPDGSSVEWGFEELSRRHGDFAMVLAATVVGRNPAGVIVDARIVLGGVGATPVRPKPAEAVLVGSSDADEFDTATTLARESCNPAGDVHADALYRLEMTEVLVGRCLADANTVRPDPADQPIPPTQPTPSTEDDGVLPASAVVVNGVTQPLENTPHRKLLADWLREDCELTGTHLGCEHGVCGACTVLLDGDPVRSCLMFASQAGGRTVTTIEALGDPQHLHPLQEAFRTYHGLQCGFCTPGMVLTSLDLLERIPDPTDDQIREELSGNICRCTGYVKIVEAVREAAVSIRSKAATAEAAAGRPT